MNQANTIAESIREKLTQLQPTYVELINESQQHAGYFKGKESHFKLTIASNEFTGKRLIVRHQRVYGVLADLLTSGGGSIHALALHTYTNDEWQGSSPDSPNCLGKNQ